ncbi:MAG: hypothetical protein ACYC4R_04880 [Anaerolineae bacterium]
MVKGNQPMLQADVQDVARWWRGHWTSENRVHHYHLDAALTPQDV